MDIKENLNLYFAIKEKHEKTISLKDREAVISSIQQALNQQINSNQILIYPESGSTFVKDIVIGVNCECMEIKKTPKNEIYLKLKEMGFSKNEYASQIKRFEEMDNDFKIHKIKSNQRKKYIPLLFQKIETKQTPKEIVLIDDSIFTGSTSAAIEYNIKVDKKIFIFG